MEKPKMKTNAFIRRYLRIIVSGVMLLIIIFVAVFAPLIATHDPNSINMYDAVTPPGDAHLMGTDSFGRDIFSRIIYGARISLVISIAVNISSVVIGTVLGLITGYFRMSDLIITRILEGINALPTLLLAIVMVTVMGAGVGKLIICLSVVNLPSIARLVRSQVLSIKEKEHIECARASGASNFRIIFKYVFPLSLSPLIIRFTSGLSSTILTQASLSFLGVGLDPRIPSWGGIISEGRAYVMVHPYMCIYAGIAIVVTVLAFSIMGDGVRDILDPKLR